MLLRVNNLDQFVHRAAGRSSFPGFHQQEDLGSREVLGFRWQGLQPPEGEAQPQVKQVSGTGPMREDTRLVE